MELIRDRVQRIIADQVVKISNDKNALANILGDIIFPTLIGGVADKILVDREFLIQNNLLTMPVKDQSEYSEAEVELYNLMLEYVNSKLQEIVQSLEWNNLKDFPPKLVWDRVQRIVADKVEKISNDENMLGRILEHIIGPVFIFDAANDEVLLNKEFFHKNDIPKMPVKDLSEYSEDELEIYNGALEDINSDWQEFSQSLGLDNLQYCYLKDMPPELIQDRVQRIIADQIVKISKYEKALDMFEERIFPKLAADVEKAAALFCEEFADKALHNTVNALMKTLDIENLYKSVKEFSCDEDFNSNRVLNYPKMDHDKKWNHSRGKIKVESLDEISERATNEELQQIPDKINVEAIADTHILIEQLLNSATEQERDVIRLLSEGYNQCEIAQKLGVSQSTISRKVTKFREYLLVRE